MVSRGIGCTLVSRGRGCTMVSCGRGCTIFSRGRGCTIASHSRCYALVSRGRCCTLVSRGRSDTMESCGRSGTEFSCSRGCTMVSRGVFTNEFCAPALDVLDLCFCHDLSPQPVPKPLFCDNKALKPYRIQLFTQPVDIHRKCILVHIRITLPQLFH